ncbi:MAG: DMT family transporter, partial [Holosporales bacterium]
FTPFWFLFLRFFFSCFPFILFVKRPNCSWSLIWRYALLMWVTQLGLLAYGLYQGAPTGLSALLMQTHAPLTLIFSFMMFHYRPKTPEVMGLILALAGIGIVAWTYDAQKLTPLLYVIGAALGVALSNLLFKRQSQPINMFALIVWSSAVATPIFLMGALVMDGIAPLAAASEKLSINLIFTMGYTIILVSLLASTLYAHLIKACEPARVAPFTLLTPVVGILAGHWVFDESLTASQYLASGLIIGGLMLNQWRTLVRRPRIQP